MGQAKQRGTFTQRKASAAPKPIKLVTETFNHDAYAQVLLKDMLTGWARFRKLLPHHELNNV